MHRYAEGTLGHVEKPKEFLIQNQYLSCIAMPQDPSEMLKKTMEFLININILHASLCRGNPRKCLKDQWRSLNKSIFLIHRHAEGSLGNVEKTMEFLIEINISDASLCRRNPRKCWLNRWNSL